jgi:hypothetical protein
MVHKLITDHFNPHLYYENMIISYRFQETAYTDFPENLVCHREVLDTGRQRASV